MLVPRDTVVKVKSASFAEPVKIIVQDSFCIPFERRRVFELHDWYSLDSCHVTVLVNSKLSVMSKLTSFFPKSVNHSTE